MTCPAVVQPQWLPFSTRRTGESRFDMERSKGSHPGSRLRASFLLNCHRPAGDAAEAVSSVDPWLRSIFSAERISHFPGGGNCMAFPVKAARKPG